MCSNLGIRRQAGDLAKCMAWGVTAFTNSLRLRDTGICSGSERTLQFSGPKHLQGNG